MAPHRVLVLGAGYAGLGAAKLIARRSDAAVTIVNERTHFQERMRNHQVAAGRTPRTRSLSEFVGRDRIELVIDRVTGIDPVARQVELAGRAEPLGYDTLVYALGSHADLGAVPGAAEHAVPVATVEHADRVHDRARQASSIAVVGGGLTGIETVAELAEAHPGRTVHLVTRDAPGGMLDERGRAHLARTFDRLGIEVRAGAAVSKVGPDGLLLDDGDQVDADLVVWTTGFAVPPLAREAGLAVDERGRMLVDATLRSTSHPEVYAVGDAAAARDERGEELRMGCGPGGVAAAVGGLAVTDRLAGREPRPLRYHDAAWHVTLGRRDGIVQLGLDDGARVVTGRAAAAVKEQVLRGAVWALRHPRVGVFAASRY